jgi:hypothetical protein
VTSLVGFSMDAPHEKIIESVYLEVTYFVNRINQTFNH